MQYKDVAVQLVDCGYWAIPVKGKRPVDKGWNERRDDALIVSKRVLNGVGNLNCGVICGTGDEGGVCAIDIDVTDKPLSKKIAQSFIDEFGDYGELPLRIGKNPKCLVVAATADIFKKKKLEFTVSGVVHAIEVLGDGQQFVSYGEHPDTGKQYSWVGGKGIAEIPVGQLARVSEKMVVDWLISVANWLTAEVDGCEVTRRSNVEVVVAVAGAEGKGKGREFSEAEEQELVPTVATAESIIDDSVANVLRIRDWLRDDAEVSTEGAGGDDTAYRVACQVKDEGFSRQMCYRVMNEDGGWNSRCQPPWSDSELKKKVLSAYKYGVEVVGVNSVTDVFSEVSSDEDGDLDRGNPVTQYIFVDGINKFMNRRSREVKTGEALNITHGSDILGGKFLGEFAKFGGKSVADRLGWFPTDRFIELIDGVTYANTYKGISMSPVDCGEGGEGCAEWLALCGDIWGKYCELVLDHMAFTVQVPNKKIGWQVLTEGKPRTGKSMATKPLQYIFAGSHSVIKEQDITTGWGDIWAKKKVVFFEEVYVPGCKRFFNNIKTKLSNREVEMLNIKGQGVLFQINVCSMYLCTNELDALHFNENENKLLVIHAPDLAEMESRGWTEERYGALGEAIDVGDMSNKVYDFLLKRDVSGFSYGKLPVKTEAMYRMVEASKPDYHSGVAEILEEAEGCFGSGVFKLEEIKQALRDRQYRLFGDKGLGQVLRGLGYTHCRGLGRLEGRVKRNTFWAKNELIEGMGVAEMYRFWEREKVDRFG